MISADTDTNNATALSTAPNVNYLLAGNAHIDVAGVSQNISAKESIGAMDPVLPT